jgi:hypothetical protein
MQKVVPACIHWYDSSECSKLELSLSTAALSLYIYVYKSTVGSSQCNAPRAGPPLMMIKDSFWNFKNN